MHRPPAFPRPYGTAAAGPGGGGFSHPSHFLQNGNLQFPANIQYYQQPLNFPHAVFQNPRGVQPQNTFIGNAGFPVARPFSIPSVTLEMVECEAAKLHQNLVAAGVNVTAWKVSQDILVAFKADSWSSLGFHLQEVPTLKRLLLTEGKVSAFIHCFVCARKIASMYELGISLCQNMGVRKFEELGLGPFLHHPLIKHYFSVPSDLTEIFKITCEEIIVSLQEFINKSKKKISVENFLMFIAEQKSVPKEVLGVRIQPIGFYVNHIREASKAEYTLLKEKVNRSIAGFYDNEVIGKMGGSKPCKTAVEKQILDNRFDNIFRRVKTFCSKLNKSSNKHVYFVSSDDNNDSKIDDDFDVEDDGEGSDHQSISPVKGSGQFVSSCPYPSNSEEMVRLGLKPVDNNKPSPASGCISMKENMKSFKRKRKLKNNNSANSSCKFLKSVEVVDSEAQGQMCDLTLSNGDTEKFVATWKVACQKHSLSELLDMMLNFYVGKPRKREKIKKLISSYPIIGCFNVTVTSIKRGMFDSMYDTFLALNENELMGTGSVCFGEMMDGRPTVEVSDPTISIDCGYSVTNDDIIKKIASYFENYQMTSNEGGLSPEKLSAIKKLNDCEIWLMSQFNVSQFCSLGHGNFYDFLEKYSSILPPEMHVFFSKQFFHESSVEACLNQQQLGVMLSQAEGNLIAKADASNFDTVSLLKKQFPTASFRVVGLDPQKKFRKLINKENGNSSCVLFSACLLGDQWNRKLLVCKENSSLDMKVMETEVAHQYTCRTTSKDAIECLLKAPMLADMLYWSHWDLLYAPSLGPLPEFLLNIKNYKNLLCIATVDGKFVRIDHAATVDEFLEAFVQCSSFRMALKFLSLLSLYRGSNNAPLALLKCYAQKAVDVIIQNSTDSIEVNVGGRNFIPGKIVVNTCSCCNFVPTKGFKDYNGSCDHSTLYAGLCRVNSAIATISRTILECLQYMPSEFRSSAAEILLSGVRSITKQAPIVFLNQCNRTEERIMLHDIGISLGVAEWVTDHHHFSSSTVLDLSVPFKAADQFSSSFCLQSALDHRNSGQVSEVSASENQKATLGKIGDALMVDANCGSSSAGNCATTSIFKEFGDIDGSQALCEATAVSTKISEDQVHDATAIVELIRQEEFGLSSNSNKCVDKLLKKQHARLGRALHCLSQELYSQDSHFILELVQNADDNIYPGDVEPELVFILHENGIVVLNNELGFSAENIRALCDVGNSTKKGSGGGYIGKKGIGFKSVFRVTDAPEIHSNGFHVKFDITEGQIGFVLPTVIPPCDAGTFKQYLCDESYHGNDMAWNTCILLPFRSQSKGGAGVSSIISMFSDLHPSLLLFLHRLRCIKFRNLLSDRVIVMRKNTLHDGIVKVSHGEEVMSWLVTSKKLRPSVIRTDVETTDISLAFTLQESEYGEYKPILRNQPVFSFLPLRNYGLKFILQGDFVLPSSREEVDGDSAWNQWLLSEFPSLFFSAEQYFCSLPCFLENPGKAVTIYMSFVPLVGEVHGFFSQLPQMIISLLRISNCLLQDSPDLTWVIPCRVLRSWNEESRLLLSNHLLQRHLGLVYLHKDVKLSDTLAMSLGIRDYGPKILVEVMESVCHSQDDLKSLGIDWLSAWLAAVYSSLSMNLTQHSSSNADVEYDIINDLKNILLIPLSDGSYGYVADGPIWLPCDVLNIGSKGEYHPADFPCLYKNLQIVNPQLFSVATKNPYSMREIKSDDVMQMLLKIGVQHLSAHEVIRSHILVALSNKYTSEDRDLMIEYLSFIMLHLQSDCASCYSERREIITELGKLPLLLTNHGYKCPSKEPIHFGREYGNHVDAVVLFDAVDIKWIEVDPSYLKHPSTLSLSSGLMKWRAFFLDLGVTDFVQVTFTDKSVEDFLPDGTLSITSFSSATSYVKDCESHELVNLLSILSSKKLRTKCIYLLEVLDKMWDDSYSVYAKSFIISKIDGAKKPIVSSFMKSIHEFAWIASSMDKDLHQPYNVFYDCEQVHSVFGMMGPYAVPKVNSMVLVNDIGFKMEVSINDAVEILQFWRMSMSPFVSSIAQMLKFYTLISSGIATASSKIIEELISSCSIFVPFISCCQSSAPASGMFLSPKEVYWQDPTGCVDKMKELMLLCTSVKDKQFLCKSLETVYPTLRDFFVNVCGVPGTPSFSSYFQILQQLSAIALPSQAAHKVFQVMVRWGDDLKSGLVSPDQILELKDNFMKLENTVLPTKLDKWVSLHPSFGLICWSDDDELKKQFKHSDGVDFIQFGELSVEEKAMLSGGVATIFHIIGVPPLSEIVSREAICYGTEENRDKVSLLSWVIPYAQRYIHKLHPETYLKLKQLGFEKLTQLQVVVVSKLFYKYTLQGRDCASKRRFECNCVLQGNILYACPTTDAHSMFLELSRYFFNGSSELHFANFLHMVSTMAQSDSTDEQIDFFVINSQKIPKLPDDESLWSISSVCTVDNTTSQSIPDPSVDPECGLSKSSHRKPGISSCWPPTDWKTAPDFEFSRSRNLRTRPYIPPQVGFSEAAEDVVAQIEAPVSVEITGNWTLEEGSIPVSTSVLQDSASLHCQSHLQSDPASEPTAPSEEHVDISAQMNLSTVPLDKPRINRQTSAEHLLRRTTGKLGEMLAYKYYTEKLGCTDVRWVNEENESGLPYDLVVGENETKQYIEVKATQSATKDWFEITSREWQFAFQKQDSYSIAHVAILGTDKANVTVLKNPYKLCRQNVLGLALLMPKR